MSRILSLLLALASALSVSPARAHTLSVSHLDIAAAPGAGDLQVELDLAIRDLALSFPLDANHDERVTWGELQAIREPLFAWVLSGVSMASGSDDCQLWPNGLAVRRYADGAYATVRMRAQCPSRGRLSVRYSLLFASDPQHRALVAWRDGEAVVTGIASAGAQRVALTAGDERPFLEFLREGVHHILIGYDHLAFLLSLLLPAALVRTAGKWEASTSLRRSGGHVFAIVTAFTVAHSVTLGLSALGWIRPAPKLVEAAIAASVALAALNNVRPLVTRRVWVVGFCFGLVHGFGFAGALGELGLPQDARLRALLGFNLGVEAGQLLVVLAVLPVLFALRHKSWYARFFLPAVSLAIAALAAYWFYQRIAP